MSIDQAQRALNQIDKDIADLEKKMADLARKEADKTQRIGNTQRNITKNTSESMMQSKLRQIDSYQKELTKIISDKASVNKKLADKRKKRADASVKLQKEEATQTKVVERQQKRLQETYERQIVDLKSQLVTQSILSAPDKPSIFSTDIDEEYDVFLSHATEDKDSFVDEFVRILREDYRLNIWYDALTIKWGDSIRTKIDQGLKRSKFGVVVLSRSYIKKHWTQYELEGLFQRESYGGKLILPIWHDITKQEVMNFSPSLAGKLAMSTAIMTLQEIDKNLKELVDEPNAPKEES